MSLFRLAIATVSLIGATASAFAAEGTAITKEQLPALVKEIIMNDPGIVMEAAKKFREQEQAQAKKKAAEVLTNFKGELYANPLIPAAGASIKDADVTIIEFFDYHCGYCKHFLPELNKLIAEDKKVRILLMDFPILSEDSAMAARAAVAVNMLDKTKYFPYHQALMNEKGAFKEERLLEIAKNMGIKPDALKKAMASEEVEGHIAQVRDLAGKLNITGTPGIIIGDTIIPGAMEYEDLKKEVKLAREAAKEKKKK